jgi:hypothetical protein
MPALSMLRRKDTPPASTAEVGARAKLAEAIANAQEARAQQQAIGAALAKAEAAASRANDAVAEAERTLERTPSEVAEYMAAQERGAAGPAPMSAREARTVLAEAKQAQEDRYAERNALRVQLRAAQERPGFADSRVNDAAWGVVRAEAVGAALAMAVELRDLMSQVSDKVATFEFLARNKVLPGQYSPAPPYCYPDDPIANTVASCMNAVVGEWQRQLGKPSGVLVWMSALEALKTDAAAPLPDA